MIQKSSHIALGVAAITFFVTVPFVSAATVPPSSNCAPAVRCSAGENYYNEDCRPAINTIADCGTAPAGRYYSFSCSEGCFLRTTPTPNPCPGGIMINSECKTIVNVIKDGVGGLFKIWDGSALSRLVYLADSDCTANQVAKWNGSRWACADDVGGGGGTNPWQISGTNVYYNGGNVGVGPGASWSIRPPVAPLDVQGNGTIGGSVRFGIRPSNEAIGGNSFATGNSSSASGYAATAMGSSSSASNTASMAMGATANSSGMASVAMGMSTTASGQASIAMGAGTTAAAINSVAIGSNVNVASAATGSVGFGLNSAVAIPQITTPNVMSILGGKVGIGTVTPTDLLQVAGNARATQFCLGATGNCISSWPSGGVGGTWTEASGNVYRSGGNVGVGTPAPVAALDVRGAVRFGDPTETPVGAYSLAAGYDSEATQNYSMALGYSAHALGERSVALGAASRASGLAAVAIGGINSASGNFSMALGSNTTAEGISSTSMGSFTHAVGNYSTSLGANITVSSTAINSVGIGLGAASTLDQPNTMAIMGGRVGIGTATPDRLLTLAGAGTSYMNFKDGIRDFLIGTDSAGGIISTITNHPISLRTQNIDRLTIGSDGNVGIGTTVPAGKLHVADGNLVLSNGSSGNALLRQQSNGIFSISNGGTNRMAIEPDGDTKIIRLGVGPNDVNPVTTLDVDGTSVFRKRMSLGNNFAPYLDTNPNSAGVWMSARASHPTFFYGVQSETTGAEKAGVYSNDAGWLLTFTNQNGRVGIGTPSPAEKLDVAGNTKIRGNLIVDGTIAGTNMPNIQLRTTEASVVADATQGTTYDSIDIMTTYHSICFLTRFGVTGLEDTGIIGSSGDYSDCRVVSRNNAWYLEARAGEDARTQCGARCIQW